MLISIDKVDIERENERCKSALGQRLKSWPIAHRCPFQEDSNNLIWRFLGLLEEKGRFFSWKDNMHGVLQGVIICSDNMMSL